MHSKRRTKLAALAATFATGAMLASAASAHAATEYQLTIAKTPVTPNANQTAPLFAINNLGTPVGTAFFDGLETQPTLGADFQRLTVPGDPTGEAHTGEAFGINDSGTVVGFAQEDALDTETGFGLERPFVWDNGAVGRELRIMPNRSVQPEGINNAGDIVGLSFAGNGFVGGDPTKTKGFELGHDGTLTTLPPLTGGKTSKAAGVGPDGLVVGQADRGDTTQQFATSWRDGVPTSLGTLGTGNFSAAFSVNGSDVAVGFSNDRPGGAHHAVVYAGGTVTDLGFPTFGTGKDVAANAINEAGTIVGTGDLFTGTSVKPRAIRYQAGQAVDLNTLIAPGSGFTLTRATDVNDAGQIVGTATPDAHPDTTVSYILTPLG